MRYNLSSVAKKKVSNLRNFLSPIDKELTELFNKSGTKPIRFWIEANNTHFMERVIERDVDKGHLGTSLTKLMKTRVCELLYFFEVHRKMYDDGIRNSSTFYINIKYKTVNMVLMCRQTGAVRRVIPKTVLPLKAKPIVDYTISFD